MANVVGGSRALTVGGANAIVVTAEERAATAKATMQMSGNVATVPK